MGTPWIETATDVLGPFLQSVETAEKMGGITLSANKGILKVVASEEKDGCVLIPVVGLSKSVVHLELMVGFANTDKSPKPCSAYSVIPNAGVLGDDVVAGCGIDVARDRACDEQVQLVQFPEKKVISKGSGPGGCFGPSCEHYLFIRVYGNTIDADISSLKNWWSGETLVSSARGSIYDSNYCALCVPANCAIEVCLMEFKGT